jgi:putative oxidoreductase
MTKLFSFSATPLNKDLGLLIIRFMVGILMAFYGFEKLTHFSEMATSDFWTKNVSFLGLSGGIPLALTIFAEFFCSAFLILGLFTRLSLFFLLFCMAYIFLVVFPLSIVDKGDNGYHFNDAFVYFAIYLGLFFTGPGKYSVDQKMFSKVV